MVHRVLRASRRAKLSRDGVHILRHTCVRPHDARCTVGNDARARGTPGTGMTQRYMHPSQAAFDAANRLLDRPAALHIHLASAAEVARTREPRDRNQNRSAPGRRDYVLLAELRFEEFQYHPAAPDLDVTPDAGAFRVRLGYVFVVCRTRYNLVLNWFEDLTKKLSTRADRSGAGETSRDTSTRGIRRLDAVARWQITRRDHSCSLQRSRGRRSSPQTAVDRLRLRRVERRPGLCDRLSGHPRTAISFDRRRRLAAVEPEWR